LVWLLGALVASKKARSHTKGTGFLSTALKKAASRQSIFHIAQLKWLLILFSSQKFLHQYS
jgi:hypothetical protein